MYRLVVESLLGLRLDVDNLDFAPCLPADRKSFTMHYRYRETVYHIVVLHTRDGDGDGETGVTADGAEQPDPIIPLVDDHRERSIEVRVYAARQPHSGAKAAAGSGERMEESGPESA